MVAYRSVLGAAMAAGWILACALAAAEEKPQTPRVIAPAAPGGMVVMQGGAQPYVPMAPPVGGYYMLQMEQVQKEVELVPEQVEKLKALAKQYQDEMRRQWEGFGSLPLEQRTAKAQEIQANAAKRAEFYQKQIEEILLPHQLEAIKEINLRTRSQGLLASPFVMDQLGVSAEQKEKLNQFRQDMQEKMWQLQKENFKKAFDLLTPEQREKLQKMTEPGYRFQAVKPGGEAGGK